MFWNVRRSVCTNYVGQQGRTKNEIWRRPSTAAVTMHVNVGHALQNLDAFIVEFWVDTLGSGAMVKDDEARAESPERPVSPGED